jgi:hypothetical protein
VGSRVFLARSLVTWLVAAPLGLLLRALVMERAVVPTAFMAAALGFGGLMLLGWRLAFALLHSRIWPDRARPAIEVATPDAPGRS